MPRRGLNCTLSYKTADATRAYRVRVSRVVFDFDVLAEESQARTARAMYPRKHTAPTEFAIMIDLINRSERESLNNYLMGYADYILDPANDSSTFSAMTVSLPARNFVREGVPKTGIQFGVVLGEMTWHPLISFETSRETIDWEEGAAVSIAQLDLAGNTDPATQFFYPSGVQLYGSQAAAVQAAVSGVDPSQVAQDTADAIEDFFGDIFGGGG